MKDKVDTILSIKYNTVTKEINMFAQWDNVPFLLKCISKTIELISNREHSKKKNILVPEVKLKN